MYITAETYLLFRFCLPSLLRSYFFALSASPLFLRLDLKLSWRSYLYARSNLIIGAVQFVGVGMWRRMATTG